MTRVTVAIPFRGGALDREIHAEYVAARLAEMLPEAQHLVVDVEGEFSRARARNEAVRQAGDGVVVLCDADTVPQEAPLRDAIAAAADDGRLHLPYTTFRGLSAEGTLAVYARGLDPHHAPAAETSMRSIGGIWVIRADAYWQAGGMDEQFRTWGFEDDAFWAAAGTLLGEPVRHHGVITHLRHEQAARIGSPAYRRNRARNQLYTRARTSPEQMRRLVGVPGHRSLRVVALAHYYPPAHRAGAELMLHELLRALADRGHQVTVWATDEQRAAVVDGITVHTGTPGRLAADVVVSHLKSVPLARRVARMARARLVQVAHSAAPWIAQDVARGADLIVANTHHVAAALPDAPAPRLVVHPPVWPDRHATTPGDAVTLINPLPEKGAKVFYELAERLPDVPFLAVEGGYQQRQQIRRDDLPNVTWQPHTADMRTDVWARTRVLLMPSAEESYGMCAIEAAASGIPTIAAPTDGLREALGDAGTFADPGDLDAWERAVQHLLGDGWGPASVRARALAAGLDPAAELTACCKAIEHLKEA
ncbi:glycosyltransferase [Spirillospora sp. NBC_01491]|uniref:glycosyltransferase n=1 Tax=Spirillospora sp. NBC_01491 TaxID=2976007 RepID=UPI002E34E453|nr:glycosyltransferase [Spirillospora sp. NBC_01491]